MLLKIFNSRYHYENYMSIDFLKDAQNLKNIYRQGWIEKLKISSPESVGDHTYFMAIMGMIFSSKTNLNTEKILKMILIHDLAESKIGDITPEKLPFDEKRDLENSAFFKICQNLSKDTRLEFLELWKEFQETITLESQFVHQIDKLEMAFQAKIYEKSIDNKDNIEIFLQTARNSITNQKLKEILSEIEEMN
jgi:putative hydrolase of HD superfamily